MIGKSMSRVNMRIIKVFLIAASMFGSMSASANKVISTPGKAAVVVTQGGNSNEFVITMTRLIALGQC